MMRSRHLLGALSLALLASSLGSPAFAQADRTLDEITIEGEIAVPQVLFISGRDQWRYTEFLEETFLPSGVELGGSLRVPSSVWLFAVMADPAWSGRTAMRDGPPVQSERSE